MPKKGRTSPEPLTAEERLLRDWLAKADNVTLACWDEGHWWWTPELDELGFTSKDGMLGIKEPCKRVVDGLGCGVMRTRFVNPHSGYLDGPSAAYDYSGAPKHKLPRDPDSGYSILSRESRAAIRLERIRRGQLGEEVR